jgi:hypothetical protein
LAGCGTALVRHLPIPSQASCRYPPASSDKEQIQRVPSGVIVRRCSKVVCHGSVGLLGNPPTQTGKQVTGRRVVQAAFLHAQTLYQRHRCSSRPFITHRRTDSNATAVSTKASRNCDDREFWLAGRRASGLWRTVSFQIGCTTAICSGCPLRWKRGRDDDRKRT